MTQAFSHYTWYATRGELLVTGLQGVVEGRVHHLTTPTIHSRSRRFGPSDGGVAGAVEFFSRHRCNNVCCSWPGLDVPAAKSALSLSHKSSLNLSPARTASMLPHGEELGQEHHVKDKCGGGGGGGVERTGHGNGRLMVHYPRNHPSRLTPQQNSPLPPPHSFSFPSRHPQEEFHPPSSPCRPPAHPLHSSFSLPPLLAPLSPSPLARDLPSDPQQLRMSAPAGRPRNRSRSPFRTQVKLPSPRVHENGVLRAPSMPVFESTRL